MARSHRQVRRRLIALFNVMFVVGALALLGGVSLLVFALGWYSMGEDMRNPKLWSNVYPCQVTSYRTELGGSTYKATTKVIFQVAFANQTNLCALAHLDPWVSPEEAQNEVGARHFPSPPFFILFFRRRLTGLALRRTSQRVSVQHRM
jgi:hypothetical protein